VEEEEEEEEGEEEEEDLDFYGLTVIIFNYSCIQG